MTQTKGILFLGTPHRGSSFTQLGSVAAWLLRPLGSNRSILDEIQYDLLNLQDLHEQFTGTIGDNLRVCNFFEERPTRLVDLGFVQWSKFVSAKRIRPISSTYSNDSALRSSLLSTSAHLIACKTWVWRWIIPGPSDPRPRGRNGRRMALFLFAHGYLEPLRGSVAPAHM